VARTETTASPDAYTLHPMNARRHASEEVRESLREFGQYKPVVVSQRTGYVVAGNGLLLALRAEGFRRVWFTLVPDLSDADELRLLAKDNTTHDKGGYDDAKLLELLDAIADDQQGLAGTGYTDKDREKLRRLAQSGADQTADLFRTAGQATGAVVRKGSVLRVPIPDGDQVDEIDRWLHELGKRWELDSPAAVIHEALRRAVDI